jgi:hypothetical protein
MCVWIARDGCLWMHVTCLIPSRDRDLSLRHSNQTESGLGLTSYESVKGALLLEAAKA